MQIEILSLESGAPTDLLTIGIAELMAQIAEEDDSDDK